jgi:hypothetical protein
MELNLISGKTGKEAAEAYTLTLMDFWKTYFHLLNLRWNYYVTPKEIEVISWVLTQDPSKSYFSTPHNNEIMEAMNNVSMSELTRVKQRLLSLGLIKEADSKDRRIRHAYPVEQLQKLRKYVEAKGKVTFVFPIKLGNP